MDTTPSQTASLPVATQQIHVAFWNLQNLFDIDASKLATDLEFTPGNGWDRQTFERKVTNLAEMIRLMFDGDGPDLLGVCEIENKRVGDILIRAIGRDDYALAHVEHPDICGLDTSLIYSTRLFELNTDATSGHTVSLRYPTRDIFEVHLKVKSNQSDLVVLVNHWPSRKPGRQETEPFRVTVASHCGRLVADNVKLSRRDYLMLQDNDQALQTLNDAWNRNVLLMGDFNDEPWSHSVMDVLGAVYSSERIAEPVTFARGCLPSYRAYASRAVPLFNPMWSLVTSPNQGTSFDPEAAQPDTLRDQFMVSRGLYYGLQGLQVQEVVPGIPQVGIFRPTIMSTEKGRPREFHRDTRTGYSNHFPVTTTINVLDR
ncbi:MAG: hypothetical protein R3C59_20255 [Planctomycetaceae bacterium]